jgi:hypothetical protein
MATREFVLEILTDPTCDPGAHVTSLLTQLRCMPELWLAQELAGKWIEGVDEQKLMPRKEADMVANLALFRYEREQ